jgi:hypothetical protein
VGVNPLPALQGWRAALRRPSARFLVAVNLALIAGVVAWDWSVFDIVFLYWVENLAIGAINVLRMATATGEEIGAAGTSGRTDRWYAARHRPMQARGLSAARGYKLFLVPFFIVHYGGFCYGHGVFVVAMFGDGALGGSGAAPFRLAEYFTPSLSLAVALLGASHLFSFFWNFIRGGEYRRTHAAILMMRPYGRIVALHITIIVGALLTGLFGSPLALLIVLVIMKTGADLALHQAERDKLGPAMVTAANS